MEFKGSEVASYLKRGLIYSVIFWAFWQFAANFNILPNAKVLSAFYPAPALTMALIAVFGWRYLPIAFLAASFGNAPDIVPWDQPTYVWFNNLRQMVVYGPAGLLLARLLIGNKTLDNTRNVLIFLVVGIGAAFVSAWGAMFIFYYFEIVPPKALSNIFFSFWAGDATGILMIAPLAFYASAAWKKGAVNSSLKNFWGKHKREVVFALIVPAFIAAPAFAHIVKNPDMSGYGYLILIPIVWIAATLGATFGAIAALSSNLGAAGMYAVLNGSAFSPTEIQVFFTVAAGMGLVIGAARDDRVKAEGKVLEQENAMSNMSRMASIGELGSSIAHEIATPLQTASINSQLSMKRLAENDASNYPEILDYQNEVQNAVKRATEIHNRIREFSRGSTSVAVQGTDLVSAFSEAERLLKRNMQQSAIKLSLHKETELPLASADPTSMQQVFLNLLKNAVAAMEEDNSEKRDISCVFRVAEGRLLVDVTDTGPGLTDDQKTKIFESFYTTKEDGLGLGLAICRTTLEGFGGNINLIDKQNGTTFRISLPVHKGDET